MLLALCLKENRMLSVAAYMGRKFVKRKCYYRALPSCFQTKAEGRLYVGLEYLFLMVA